MKLLAYRSEVTRYLRMSRIIGAARAIVQKDQGTNAAEHLYRSLVTLEDLKGDFTAIWKDQESLDRFSRAIDAAIGLENEEEITHIVEQD